MKICLNCGYERQEKDDKYGIIPSTECPKCHAIYEKVERAFLEKEYKKAKGRLTEQERDRHEVIADSLPDMGQSQQLEKAKWHYNLGNNAFDKGLYENAIDEYATAIKLAPSYASAYVNRGLAYRKLMRRAEAMVDLKVAARLGSKMATEV